MAGLRLRRRGQSGRGHRNGAASGGHLPPEELSSALSAWRLEAKRGCLLAAPFDPARDRLVGDAGATTDVVEYLGHGSISAARADREIRAALRELLDRGRICFAWRHFPMIDAHPEAWPSACAVEAAGRQGAFWELHETLLEAWSEAGRHPAEPPEILVVARELGLDVERLVRDMELPEVAERIVEDFGSGVRSGVNGTPTFFVAGVRQIVDGPRALVARIEAALAGNRDALWPPGGSQSPRSLAK
jgi:predicted DsbA family dithiol-disulfide isomerase